MDELRIRIGISACLLGQEVRFDGGHKRDPFLADVLGPHVEWVAVCPEVELGMGTPREPLRLVASERPAGPVRMIAVQSGVDQTDQMNEWAEKRVEKLSKQDLCGYVLKQDSPSCGLDRVKVYGTGGVLDRSGRGLFAAVLKDRLRLLPVEEEGRLADRRVRESFIERVFAYHRMHYPHDFSDGYDRLLIDMLSAIRNHV
jgi:uncharacterized protein YbbK (DUF523 family)